MMAFRMALGVFALYALLTTQAELGMAAVVICGGAMLYVFVTAATRGTRAHKAGFQVSTVIMLVVVVAGLLTLAGMR